MTHLSNHENGAARPVHELIAEMLLVRGTQDLFGLIGDASFFMVDSFVRKFSGRRIGAMSDANAVLLALGFPSPWTKPASPSSPDPARC